MWLEGLLKNEGEVQPILKVNAASWASYCVGMQGDFDRAIALCAPGIKLFKETGDKYALLWALVCQGLWYIRTGPIERSLKTCEECVALARKVGDIPFLMRSLSNLGQALALVGGDFARGEEHYREGLSIAREQNSEFYKIVFLLHLAGAALRKDDFVQAANMSKSGLSIANKVGSLWNLQIGIGLLAAAIAFGEGRPKRAATLFGIAEGLIEKMAINTFSALHPDIRRKSLEVISESIDEQAFQAAWNKGLQMTPDEAAEYALQGD